MKSEPIPRRVGKPALRALNRAGLTNLRDLTRVSESDVKQMHGVGPTALAVLREALAAHRLSFAETETRTVQHKNDDQIDAFFSDRPEAYDLFKVVLGVIESFGAVEVRVTKSQVSFSRRRGFAWAWTPDRWLKGPTAPLVVSIALPKKSSSSRWKEVVEPRDGRWVHHLEVRSADDFDDELAAWLREAWEDAG